MTKKSREVKEQEKLVGYYSKADIDYIIQDKGLSVKCRWFLVYILFYTDESGFTYNDLKIKLNKSIGNLSLARVIQEGIDGQYLERRVRCKTKIRQVPEKESLTYALRDVR